MSGDGWDVIIGASSIRFFSRLRCRTCRATTPMSPSITKRPLTDAPIIIGVKRFCVCGLVGVVGENVLLGVADVGESFGLQFKHEHSVIQLETCLRYVVPETNRCAQNAKSVCLPTWYFRSYCRTVCMPIQSIQVCSWWSYVGLKVLELQATLALYILSQKLNMPESKERF